MMNSNSTDSEWLDPFPGLRPFQNDEDYLFFGREDQVGELMDLLRSHQFVAVVGTSGSGKSSLVRCGLLSELQGGMMVAAGSRWEVAVMQPGGDPLANLAQALIDAELYDGEDSENFHRILATVNRSTHGLVQAVNQSEIQRSAPAATCCLWSISSRKSSAFTRYRIGVKNRHLISYGGSCTSCTRWKRRSTSC